jgi:hypothetical protein
MAILACVFHFDYKSMSMKKITLVVFVMALLFNACKKVSDFDPSANGSPVFEVSLTDDSMISTPISAGVNGYYLFTDFEYISATDNSLQQTSSFAPANCPSGDCPGSFQFEFQGFNFSDSVGLLEYVGTGGLTPSFYRTTFTLLNTADYAFTTFTVDGVSTTISSSLTSTIVRDFANGGPQMAQLYSFSDSSISTLTGTYEQIIHPANPDAQLIYPSAYFNLKQQQGVIQITANNNLNWDYKWSTGDTSYLLVQDSLPEPAYSLVVTNPSNNSTSQASISGINIDLEEANSPYFTYKTELVADSNAQLVIRYVDDNGTLWSSDRFQQPTDAFCNYIVGDIWENNEKGQKNRKVSLVFACFLFNADGTERWVSGTAKLALAYP